MKKLVISTLSLIVLITGGITVSAATEYPDGGTWNYGVGATGSYSDYLHNSKQHSATVTKGRQRSYSEQPPTKWAKARLFEYSGCEFFYNSW